MRTWAWPTANPGAAGLGEQGGETIHEMESLAEQYR